MTNLYDDLTARMVPAPVKVREALGDIADTGRTMAVVPIAFVNKEYGIWDLDIEVENDIDGCFPCDNDDSYRAARRRLLRRRPPPRRTARHGRLRHRPQRRRRTRLVGVRRDPQPPQGAGVRNQRKEPLMTNSHTPTVRVERRLWHGLPVWIGEFSNASYKRWWRHAKTPEATLAEILPVFESVIGHPFEGDVPFIDNLNLEEGPS